jgi:uncharacterized protein (TIGR03435 family)
MSKALLHPIAKAILIVAVVAGVASGQVNSQASNPLSFEVASIRPAPPLDAAAIMSGKMHLGMSVDKDRVDIGGFSLMALICQAYKVEPYQVAGNPEWLSGGINADRFDIIAKMPEGATKDQVPQMLQALLAERFKLTVHYEKRDLSAYALVVGKDGPKLKEAEPEPAAPAPAAETANASSGETSGTAAPDSSKSPAAKGEMAFGSGDNRVTMKPSHGGMVINSKDTGTVHVTPGESGAPKFQFDGMTMETFAKLLSQFVDRPVVDLTELKGKYKVAFDVPQDAIMAMARRQGVNVPAMLPSANVPGLPADAAPDPSGGSLFTSVQQLGLKLEKRKLPGNFLVIDHVERTPTEN